MPPALPETASVAFVGIGTAAIVIPEKLVASVSAAGSDTSRTTGTSPNAIAVVAGDVAITLNV
ncbi:MAG: hypothetical protein Q8M65_00965, partial [Rhodoglobus sp.]|nr:hypothetical protein [Rhodoglobus sp.]